MINVRNAAYEDAARLAELCAENIPQPWSESSFAAEFDKGSVMLCACEDNRIIGFAATAVSFDEGYLELIAVDRAYRRGGYGTFLLRETEAALADRGVSRVVLDVRCSNTAAIELYKKCGYGIVCTRRDFYGQPREDAYTMTKDLK